LEKTHTLPSVSSRNDWREGIKGRGIRKVIMHPHLALSPAFAEAASRRQASRERGNRVESMSILGTQIRFDKGLLLINNDNL
jgi:hypothetical protein